MLKPGDKAPDFTIPELNGRSIRLTELRGQKVLLSLFRTASCPFCNLRVHEMIQKHSELSARGLDMIAVFPSGKEEIKQYAGKQEPPFAIIPDPEEQLYQTYHMKRSSLGALRAMKRIRSLWDMWRRGFMNTQSMKAAPILPADFLIDEKGKILIAYYGNDFGDHLPWDEIEKALKTA